MGIWSIFQNRRRVRCGDGEGYASRLLDVPVKRVGGSLREIRGVVTTEARDQEALLLLKSRIPCFQEKPLSFSHCWTVPQTDTGGRDEYSQALERTLEKELGKLTP